MIGVLIVTHGGLADELVAAARVIAGEHEQVDLHALSLEWRIGLAEARALIAAAASRADRGEGVLILTDMFGDTPSRAAQELRREGAIEVISGVNLPMVVRLTCSGTKGQSLREAADAIAEKGRRSICRAGEAGADSESRVGQNG